MLNPLSILQLTSSESGTRMSIDTYRRWNFYQRRCLPTITRFRSWLTSKCCTARSNMAISHANGESSCAPKLHMGRLPVPLRRMSTSSFFLARTDDAAAVRQVLLQPSQFPHLGEYRDDKFFIDLVTGCWCVVALHGYDLNILALYILDPVCESIAKVHISVLPESWGASGLGMSRQFVDWTWQNTKFRKLIGHIDQGNRLAVKFAERCGMREVGHIPMGLEKNGTKRDLVVMELNK